MHSFDLALSAHCYPPVTNYPAVLSHLSPNDVSPLLFICPGDTEGRSNVASRVAEADRTTSFIYIGNLSADLSPDMPVMLCPPIHHEGEGGNVLFGDHRTSWTPKPEFDKLIDKLYADTNLMIVVSEALTKRSRGRYKSRP
ncbi:MAG: hypothetical protein E4H01_08320 [Lysobacterales bacterium]|nr:MAG: hypothetical protein E4H01_08320 [Xanthomonadales bacterium]